MSISQCSSLLLIAVSSFCAGNARGERVSDVELEDARAEYAVRGGSHLANTLFEHTTLERQLRKLTPAGFQEAEKLFAREVAKGGRLNVLEFLDSLSSRDASFSPSDWGTLLLLFEIIQEPSQSRETIEAAIRERSQRLGEVSYKCTIDTSRAMAAQRLPVAEEFWLQGEKVKVVTRFPGGDHKSEAGVPHDHIAAFDGQTFRSLIIASEYKRSSWRIDPGPDAFSGELDSYDPFFKYYSPIVLARLIDLPSRFGCRFPSDYLGSSVPPGVYDVAINVDGRECIALGRPSDLNFVDPSLGFALVKRLEGMYIYSAAERRLVPNAVRYESVFGEFDGTSVGVPLPTKVRVKTIARDETFVADWEVTWGVPEFGDEFYSNFFPPAAIPVQRSSRTDRHRE